MKSGWRTGRLSILAGSLIRSKNTVSLAFRVPASWWLRVASYYYKSWPLLNARSADGEDRATSDDRRLYRRAATIGALLHVKEGQIAARIKIAAIVIGLIITGTGWIWLILSNSSGRWRFAVISIVFFLINSLLVAPAAAYTGNPWRRLVELAVAWSAASVVLLAINGWPALTDWTTKTSSWPQVLSLAAGAVALFCLFGALLARIAFFAVDLIIARRRVRKFPNHTALFRTVELLNWLDDKDGLGNAERRRWAIQMLELISTCVGIGIPAILAMPPNNIRSAVHNHFRQAATTITTYQMQVALPQPNSETELRKQLAELAMTFLTTNYHGLPINADPTENESPTKGQRLRSLLVGLLVAAVPLAVVGGSYASGFRLPDYLQQWLAGFAIVWLIARITQLFDPSYSITWERVHNSLGAPRTPPGQP